MFKQSSGPLVERIMHSTSANSTLPIMFSQSYNNIITTCQKLGTLMPTNVFFRMPKSSNS